ncbi:MAG: hypothetical protein IJB17_00710 [Oscillospiraceae bacterium]|nr:hypothetical protein [Oscillospiraceae bacterium]
MDIKNAGQQLAERIRQRLQEMTGQLADVAAGAKAVADATKKAAKIVKGYLAGFDELQRVTVKTASGGSSSKKTAKDTETAAKDAATVAQVVAAVQPKLEQMGEAIRKSLWPVTNMDLSHVTGQLEQVADHSYTIGGGLGAAVSIVTGQLQAVADKLKEMVTASDSSAGAVENRWSALAATMKDDVMQPLEQGFAGVSKSIAVYLSGAVEAVSTAVATVTKVLGNFSVKIPDSIPLVGGTSIKLPVPALAQGAVLPANKPFLALLGDQTSGTNIEAPLATIQQAVALVMEDYAAANLAGQEATVRVLQDILQAVLGIELGDSVLGQAVNRYNDKLTVMRGG